jgi:hypothetical protein
VTLSTLKSSSSVAGSSAILSAIIGASNKDVAHSLAVVEETTAVQQARNTVKAEHKKGAAT